MIHGSNELRRGHMDDTLTTKPSPSTSSSLPTQISTSTLTTTTTPYPPAHHHHPSLPYYTLDARGTRHDLDARSPADFPPRPPYPHFYPARIADANHDLTLFRPPLRKKPKLSSNAPAPNSSSVLQPSPGMRKPVGISKTLSVPSFSISLDPDPNDNRPSSSSGISQPSTPLRRTNSNTLQRSPSQKRPPASHSSYGVETVCGPPPSYSTQRTLSQDRIRLDRNPSTRSTNDTTRDSSPSKANEPIPAVEPAQARLSPVKPDQTPSTTDSSADEATTLEVSSPETADTQSVLTPNSTMSQEQVTAVLQTDLQEKENSEPQLLKPISSEEDTKGSSSDEKKSEDLFLNIARTDSSRGNQVQSKLDKRRSRVSLPFFSSTRPSTGYKSSPIQERFDTSSVAGRSEALNYYSKRSSLGQHVPGALSRTYTQDGSIRDGTLETQSTHPADLPRRATSRRYSTTNSNTNTNTEPVRTFSRPSTARNSRLVSESAFLDRPRVPDHNATESTISTTAPSTVWDELDDLKSRIRKLELTGKLPPSSAAAMTTSERPKTATTAATTMSSSPKHKPAVAQLQSAIEGIPSNIHPNLHEALGNAKAVLSNDVYQKLQATAQDALQLSMMMNPEGHSGAASTIGISSVSERQIRRRTESMCRSLTELAIAILADHKQPPQPATRPGSRDAFQSASTGLRSRRYSNEPNDRPPVTSRVQSRLETRRTSAPLGATLNAQTTSPENPYQTPPTALPQISSSTSSRLGRTSTTLVRSRRTPGYNLDGTTDDEESSPSVRPVSRAMTEVSTYRQMARDRAAYSREYTAQHPMPQHPVPAALEATNVTRSPLPAHISTHLVPRRKYATPSSNASNVGAQEHTPVTPKEPWGRITIVPAATSSPIEATPESQVAIRPSATRRSLGFTSRISSVSSRLRAAKAERNATTRETTEARGMKDIAPLRQELDNTIPLERQGSGQSVES
ncbi:uncharacterized protein PV07_10754 [Cladophialophora immunda]|uniref:LPXTG-motif cell wall anchor domain protein n=1 Tax=Cladophialophora immunda TaxID=569365 RepID=A0A0D2CNI6_9EURO|nr:uncharacterized protein PV07_10754 [Cladophialophora immunda]KIW25084.1 hypothetical protein PV07_10754 [Cladophialophora immunda]